MHSMRADIYLKGVCVNVYNYARDPVSFEKMHVSPNTQRNTLLPHTFSVSTMTTKSRGNITITNMSSVMNQRLNLKKA